MGSDHRMVGAKILVNLKKERNKLVNRNNSKKLTNVDGVEKYQKNDEEKSERRCNLEDLNRNIVESINAAKMNTV